MGVNMSTWTWAPTQAREYFRVKLFKIIASASNGHHLTGVQIRKLYEPQLFPNASVLSVFDKFFGQAEERWKRKHKFFYNSEARSGRRKHKIKFRDFSSICAVGFEPNLAHSHVLQKLERRYQHCGWKVNFLYGSYHNTLAGRYSFIVWLMC